MQREQSSKRLDTMKRNFTYNPSSKGKQSRVSKNVFESPRNHNGSYDDSVSYDDTLADHSAELDQSTLSFSALMESDFTDHSGFLETSTYDSEESSCDEKTFGCQSQESEENVLSESFDKVSVLPTVKKIRRRTVISITRAGHCVDQIDMGTLPSSTENRRKRCVETKDRALKPRSSPSRAISRDDKDLSPSAVSGFNAKSEKSLLPVSSKEAKLASLSRNLFSKEPVKGPSTRKSAMVYGYKMTNLTPEGFNVLSWYLRKGLSNDFPNQLVSHRMNVLSVYNPICSLLPVMIAAILKGTEVSKSDALTQRESRQGNDERLAVTITNSKDAAFEFSIDDDGASNGAPTTLTRDIYAYLEIYPDDESIDSDVTPKFCHRRRVSWSPQLSSHF